ncbi:NepR family anti-sigma factor [Enterovirga sp. CN4-39]|uniref:NepR family anti-sigma factor n=1 Tax=Enterovirga sp. CN4-39 TaxID=3400910 RepID=UPI003BFDF7BF
MAGSPKREAKNPGAATKQGKPESRQHNPGLDRVIQAQIGDKLRSMYGELIEQPVPDKLTAILERLGTGKNGDGA